MTFRGQNSTATKLLKISKVAKENKTYRFTSLASLIDQSYLVQCYSELKKNKASGIDGVSLEDYGNNLQENIRNLHERMLKMSYRLQPVRRVNIPKDNGKTRPLGIPSVEDKIVLPKQLQRFSNQSMNHSFWICHLAIDLEEAVMML